MRVNTLHRYNQSADVLRPRRQDEENVYRVVDTIDVRAVQAQGRVGLYRFYSKAYVDTGARFDNIRSSDDELVFPGGPDSTGGREFEIFSVIAMLNPWGQVEEYEYVVKGL